MVKNCIICNNKFECKKSTAKYCSKHCEYLARQLRKKTNQGLKTPRKCLICENEFIPKSAAANQRQCCYKCMPEGTQYTRSQFLDLIRKQRGGKCERCGYNAYLGALDFHHLDSSKKDFTIGDRDFKLKDCLEESKKCILICANCHREIHANLWNIEDLFRKEENL